MLTARNMVAGTLVFWHAPSLFGDSWSCPGRIVEVTRVRGTVELAVILFEDMRTARTTVAIGEAHKEMRRLGISEARAYLNGRIADVHTSPAETPRSRHARSHLISKLRQERRRLGLIQKANRHPLRRMCAHAA